MTLEEADNHMWSTERIKLLIEMHSKEVPLKTIGKHFGKSRNAIAGMLFRLRQDGSLPKSNKCGYIKILWKDKVDTIFKMIEDGYTLREIATAFDTTKNAIVGMMHRLKEKGVEMPKCTKKRLDTTNKQNHSVWKDNVGLDWKPLHVPETPKDIDAMLRAGLMRNEIKTRYVEKNSGHAQT